MHTHTHAHTHTRVYIRIHIYYVYMYNTNAHTHIRQASKPLSGAIKVAIQKNDIVSLFLAQPSTFLICL